MRKRITRDLLAMLAAGVLMTGCGETEQTAGTPETTIETATEGTETAPAAETGTTEEEEAPAETAAEPEVTEPVTVRIGALKGPTSIGLVGLIYENEDQDNIYDFTMETQADVVLAGVAAGDLDIALIPANVASVLYNRTSGGIRVVDINTLGVLYMVSGDDSITSMADLSGRTVYTTGKGSTPEYTLNYLLAENELTDSVTVEYKSEATEVAATLAADPTAIGMLPQPFATAAQVQNDALSVVLDMTAEWDALGNDSQLVTGVTIVRSEFLEEEPEAVERFIADHAASVAYVNANVEQAAQYVEELGIIEKAAIAQRAIPYCNIVCVTGTEMKAALSGYLDVLFQQDAASVGGTLPGDDFYLVN